MLKKIFVGLLAVTAIGFTACDESKEEVVPFLEITDENVNFKAEASVKDVGIKSYLKEYEVTVTGENTSWCLANVNTDGQKLQISVTENTGKDIRDAEVVIKSGNLSKQVKVRQLGRGAAILVSPDNFSLSSNPETIEFEITSNVDFTVILPEWIKEPSLPRAQEMIRTECIYHVERNRLPEKRTGEILIKENGGKIQVPVIVSQQGMGEYDNDDAGDIKEDLKVPVKSAEASSFQPGKEIINSVDGDLNTLFESNWNNAASSYFPISLTYSFEKQEAIDYLIYYPRISGGGNGNFKETEIWVSTEEKPEFTKIMNYNFKGSGTATRVLFDKPVVAPKAIRLVVKSGSGDGQGFAVCAEMEFYQKNPDNFDPLTLFTDMTCSELKPGITEADIDTCRYPFFQTMAYYMFENKYPAEFRIQEYKAWQHPDKQAVINKTSPYSLLDNPTGIAVESGEDLLVFVGDTHGENLSIKVQNLDLPEGDGYGDGSSYYPLNTGMNKIAMSNRGLVYVMYHTDNYETVPPVKIHIATGTVNGYFDVAKHTANQWKSLLSKAAYKYFDVVGAYAHLTFPVQRFVSNTPDGKALIDVYDDIVKLEQEFMGLRKYDKMFKNRMYFHVIYKSFMYATSYRTAYNDNTLDDLCNVAKMKTVAIWGPAHEVGHVNQTRPGLKWLGLTEVTNNIHSMYVQSSFGNPTRLQDEATPPYTNRYETAMAQYFTQPIPHCEHPDVFCKLVPFWQLYLYITKVRGNDEFYKDLYEQVRITPNQPTDGKSQLEFVRKVCDISRLNLLPFFEKWGFLTPVDITLEDYETGNFKVTQTEVDALKAEISSRGYETPTIPFWYITDNTVEVFKQTPAIQKGTAAKSGSVYSMKNWTGVVAYEVYTKEKLVFVSPMSRFTLIDTIPDESTKVFAVGADGSKVEVLF